MLNCVLQRSFPLLSRNILCLHDSRILFSVCSNPLYSKLKITKTESYGKLPPPPNPDYKVIYKYPGIESIRSISRMKLHSLYSNIIVPPMVYGVEYYGYVDDGTAISLGILATTLTISFSLIGLIINKFIGMIYYNKKLDIVKIASLSYTGVRIDDYIPRAQLSSMKTIKFFPLLSTLKDNITQKQYRVIAQNGVLDPLTYNAIFYSREEDSNPRPKDSQSATPTSEESVDLDELIKKIQSENKKNASEEVEKEAKKQSR